VPAVQLEYMLGPVDTKNIDPSKKKHDRSIIGFRSLKQA
jgi:hypothetical protein